MFSGVTVEKYIRSCLFLLNLLAGLLLSVKSMARGKKHSSLVQVHGEFKVHRVASCMSVQSYLRVEL
ncbi:hypothetical protein D918_04111 [Trichuris suis]|nr:hypothetical protein D918_04111 [Trichuris suis]